MLDILDLRRNDGMDLRKHLKDKKRIVIKIGSSSLTHPETGALNLTKMEVLVREITDLRNQGKDVILVSSGAIAVGSQAAGFPETTGTDRRKTGLCSDRSGQADDDLSKAFFGI